MIIQGFFCIFKFHLIKEREKDMKNLNSIGCGYALKSIQERYGYVVQVPWKISYSYAIFVAVAPSPQIKNHFNLLILENFNGDTMDQKLTRSDLYLLKNHEYLDSNTSDIWGFNPKGVFGYSWGDRSFVHKDNEPALIEWLKSLDKIDQHSINFNFKLALTELTALGAEIRNFQGVRS